MESEVVLVTGATGHVGFRTLVYGLNAGYTIRATVRNQAKADIILGAPSIKAIQPGKRLTFVFIPDIIAEGAYDEAVRNVDYIIHIASPLSSGVQPEHFEDRIISPAVQGTVGILSSALKVGDACRVKRVVITSSIVALFFPDVQNDADKVYDHTSQAPDPEGPYMSPTEAYCASKIKARNATAQIINDERTPFDVVNVHPSFVIGKNELVTDKNDILKGTNARAFGQIIGVDVLTPTIGHTVHIDDVADIHVRALKLKGGDKVQSLIATSGGINGVNLSNAIEIIKKRFPEEIKSGLLPLTGTVKSVFVKLDASETERRLGIKFLPYEDQVISVTQHYLDLVRKSS
jgi:nucleoside-diphosphate-sugar epimerase